MTAAFDHASCPPRRREGLASAALDGELVVYDTAGCTLHHLNRTATHVWNLCNGERSVETIARMLAGNGTPDAEAILRDVVAIVQVLSAARLLVHDAPAGPDLD
jgi:hypothetical protein